MDIFLIRDGVVQNVASVETMEQAQAMYPDLTIVGRTEANAYNAEGNPVNVGDTL